ncbi:MAG: hypothetical protein JW808_11185, partial [Victivallales bacterium]|nr:hypothetical protein [Victivallales bacterium]
RSCLCLPFRRGACRASAPTLWAATGSFEIGSKDKNQTQIVVNGKKYLFLTMKSRGKSIILSNNW